MIEKPYHAKRKRWLILGICSVLFFPALLMTLQISADQTVKCTVCMQFNGHSQCKSASAVSKDDCVRTGVDNACALISSGMTGSIACGNTPPASIQFD